MLGSQGGASCITQNGVDSRLARLHMEKDEEIARSSVEAGATGDREDSGLLPTGKYSQNEPVTKPSSASSLAWMVMNTLATLGIVFTNKAIFSDPSLKLMQLSFAAFHFLVTFLTLFALSRRPLQLFTPRRVALLDILPLSLAMSLNVILPNLSLAFSTVVVYQLARILLTPTVAILNYALYRATLPLPAILALAPTCLGVAAVSYYDSLPPPQEGAGGTDGGPSSPSRTATAAAAGTAPLGLLFALLGVLASSLYTVWIGAYHRRLRLSSMQLLYSQAPVSFVLLLYAIPFLDVFPSHRSVPSSLTPTPPPTAAAEGGGGGGEGGGAALAALHHHQHCSLPLPLILLSGLLAALINLSQFFIVARAGAVSSTVVGHVKTCLIVALGWVVSGKGVGVADARGRGSVCGVAVALGGIMTYSVIMLREKEKQAGSKAVKG
ncbi:hypothetical protein VTK26DRAFT_4556 [Humicola hyalothermophila]